MELNENVSTLEGIAFGRALTVILVMMRVIASYSGCDMLSLYTIKSGG